MKFPSSKMNSLPKVIAAAALMISTSGFAAPYLYDAGGEASPEQIKAAFGELIDADAGAKPDGRTVPSSKFGEYQIVVDIFRSSVKKPVLGKYQDPFLVSATPTSEEKDPAAIEKAAKDRFSTLRRKEFAVLSIDGVPTRAYLVSGAIEREIELEKKDAKNVSIIDDLTNEVIIETTKKTTPAGNYRLSPRIDKSEITGPDGKKLKLPTPFLNSSAFERSPMFFGLQITNNGHWIHETPHYYQLGRPASMGCIRQSAPDAMFLWNLVVNDHGGRKAMIRIHEIDSQEAYNRLREIVYDAAYVPTAKAAPTAATSVAAHDLSWIVGQLNESYEKVQTFVKKTGQKDYDGILHGWWNESTKAYDDAVWPTCGGYECFSAFGQDQLGLIAKLREADYKAYIENRKSRLKQGLPVTRKDSINLNMKVSPAPKKAAATSEKTH